MARMAKTKTGAKPETPETPATPVVRRKTDEERRDDRIPVRVTALQKEVLTMAASRAGLDVSAWLRSLGMERASELSITEASVKVAQGTKTEAPPAPKRKRKSRPKE
jgi:uncharacterized protein (DUF1778 family)